MIIVTKGHHHTLMTQGRVERRRGRRIALETPILIRCATHPEDQGFIEQRTRDISLAGIYFITNGSDQYRVDDVVVASLSVPEAQTREFPFTRLAGQGRIVRVGRLPIDTPQATSTRVAVEFGQDLIALTALPA